MEVKTDIEIAREAKKQPIQKIGEKLQISSDHLLPFGHDKAKLSAEKELGDLPFCHFTQGKCGAVFHLKEFGPLLLLWV